MIYGLRSFLPFGLGVISSVLFAFFFFDSNASQKYDLKCTESRQTSDASNYIFSSKDWKVTVRRPSSSPLNSPVQVNKVVRARFAATELGIREKCIVIVLSQSSLSLAINGYLSPHVSRIQFFADASRIDAEMSSLPNLTPLHSNGQHSHSHILNSIFNMTFHENYDFMLFISETTYVNPFALNRFVEQINWNNPQAFGYDDSGKCILKSGILLSNPAVQLLIQERHLCNSISASTDELALEMCIHHATNLSCSLLKQNSLFRWWHEESSESGSAIHDRIPMLSLSREFNLSLTVSPLLSEMDARLLHKHFVSVEIDRLDAQVEDLTGLLVGFTHSTENELSWPVGLPPLSKPPNRYQVPVWEYFTQTKILKNNPNQNVVLLAGDDALDVYEVVEAARKKVEAGKYFNAQFLRLRSGYRIFNALRGMEYVVDLEYQSIGIEAKFLKRVWLCRPIYSTRLLNSVPYVKEDTDITIVIGIESLEQVRAAKQLLQRHGRLCSASASFIDSRQTRVVLAARLVDAAAVRELNKDLVELKKRCRSWHTDTALLLLKPNNGWSVQATAMDEAVDHFGQQMIYVFLSPYADYQREFLDRVRINTIRHHQVFFPIPFAEFNPVVVKAEGILDSAKNSSISQKMKSSLEIRIRHLKRIANSFPLDEKGALQVHKNYGIFDENDFRAFSVYGADYTSLRSKLSQQKDGEEEPEEDIINIFLGQSNIHVLRAIEPSLRMHWYHRDCSHQQPNLLIKCQASKKLTLGSKPQLANLVFSDLKDNTVPKDKKAH